MRGYVATLLAGWLGFSVAWNIGTSEEFMRNGWPEIVARVCDPSADRSTCVAAVQILLFAALLGGCLVGGALAIAVALRLVRDAAIVETVVAFVAIGALAFALPVLLEAGTPVRIAALSPWQGLLLGSFLAVAPFVAARWLGVAWHRRRKAPGTWDGFEQQRTACG